MKAISRRLPIVAICLACTNSFAVSAEIRQAIRDENYQQAILLLRQVENHSSDLQVPAVDIHFELAQAYWLNNQPEQAEAAIEKVLSLRAEPQRDDYYLAGRIYAERALRASVFKRLSYARKLRDAFERSVELDESFQKGRLALMQFYLAAPGIAGGSRKKAGVMAEQLSILNTVAGLIAKSALAADDDELEAAAMLLHQALAIEPENIVALQSLAALYIEQKAFARAMPLLQQVVALPLANDVDLRRRQREAMYQIGKIAAESGQWLQDGVLALERFQSLPVYHRLPPPAWAYLRLGQIYQHLKQTRQAQAYFDLAAQQESDDKRLQRLLREARRSTAVAPE